MTTPLRPPVSAGNNSADSKTASKGSFADRWQGELNKFLNSLVDVEYCIGQQEMKISGRLVAFMPQSTCVVIDCDTRSIIVRQPLSITRLRKAAKMADAK
jgi:hypothetical protein